jgi:hypothetical protein
MNTTISINFENCYGIKKLKHDFDFSKQNVQLIYAPNGTMKSSFAKTMKYLSGQTKSEPKDQLNSDSKTNFKLTFNSSEVAKNNIYVFDAEENINSKDALSRFLASAELKKEYDEILAQLFNSKNELIKALKNISESSDCENELTNTFKNSENDTFYSILERINSQMGDSPTEYKFKYNSIFDKKGLVKKFLEVNASELIDYISEYNKLLQQSTFFGDNNGCQFGTYQAEQFYGSLKDNAFFNVGHKIHLKNDKEINSSEQLRQIIQEEQSRILSDENLQAKFTKITKLLEKNAELRDFRAIIEKHQDWIPLLYDYYNFRERVWYGYLSDSEIKPLFTSLLNLYSQKKPDIESILLKAQEEQKEWKRIVSIYNDRFHVPFKVSIQNQRDVILKQDSAELKFEYSNQPTILPEDVIINNVLSHGERRAYFIMQFLFEVEARAKDKERTIFVLDDIADSFDYQNKFAIIEYINDIMKVNNFYLFILTHNYDFYRTLSSRLSLNQENNIWFAERDNNGNIEIRHGMYVNDAFSRTFIGHDDNDSIYLSMIPFVRNLLEYTKGESSEEYSLLTSCLHFNDKTKSIKQEEVSQIIKGYLKGHELKNSARTGLIYDLIFNTAKQINDTDNPDEIRIENKIVLSIAIRLIAEEFMIHELICIGISTTDIKRNQTGKLFGKFKENFPDSDKIDILERVNMITPQIIHINSFMYEPLIDMSLGTIKQLYNDCLALKIS